LRKSGLEKAHDLVENLAALDPQEKLDRLVRAAPNRVVPFLLRHRYLALMVLLNVPGNSLIGGGGGIAFAAGLSRLFPFPLFLATVMVAVAPVPVLFLLAG
jgi:hypothetical protein